MSTPLRIGNSDELVISVLQPIVKYFATGFIGRGSVSRFSETRSRYIRAMEWSDESIVLAIRRYGDTSAILTVLSREHGRRAGLARGAAGKRKRGILQPGNRVIARWRARLADHLGTLDCELTKALAANVLFDAGRLAGLTAACAIIETALPEHEPCPRVFDGLAVLLSELEDDDVWLASYVRWELGLLGELGFGLDLAHIGAAQKDGQPVFVSTQTGQAVVQPLGHSSRERLLELPSFLLEQRAASTGADIAQGLALTSYFLEQHVYSSRHRRLPAARRRLIEHLKICQ